MQGPYMSYKSIFKRKNKIYRIGDIRIRWGVSLEQFIVIMIGWIAELLAYIMIPFMKDIGITAWIIITVLITVGAYKGIEYIDFRGMGLLHGISSVTKWFFSPKRTLMDAPVEKPKKERLQYKITTGFAIDRDSELFTLTGLSHFTLEGSLDMRFENGAVLVLKRKKPHKKSNITNGKEIVLDKVSPIRIKLEQGVHSFRKIGDKTWVYAKGGSVTNANEVSDSVLDGSYDF